MRKKQTYIRQVYLFLQVVDVVNKATRSRMMSGIRSSNTRPEILIRKALHRLGYRYKLGGKVAKIKPDIILRSRKVVVFAHGCYWHQHEKCQLAYSDRDYSEKWKKKFKDNYARDLRVKEQLLKAGWRVAVIWECVTREVVELEKAIKQLDKFIRAGTLPYFESSYRKS